MMGVLLFCIFSFPAFVVLGRNVALHAHTRIFAEPHVILYWMADCFLDCFILEAGTHPWYVRALAKLVA